MHDWEGIVSIGFCGQLLFQIRIDNDGGCAVCQLVKDTLHRALALVVLGNGRISKAGIDGALPDGDFSKLHFPCVLGNKVPSASIVWRELDNGALFANFQRSGEIEKRRADLHSPGLVLEAVTRGIRWLSHKAVCLGPKDGCKAGAEKLV